MANELDVKQKDTCKVKPFPMQTAKIIQAVILMFLVALAASCSAGKEYSSKLFGTRIHTADSSKTSGQVFLNNSQDSLGAKDQFLTKSVSTTDTNRIVSNPSVIKKDTIVMPRLQTNGSVRTKRTRND